MTNTNKQYSSAEAKKIVDEYIDQSAIRLAQRLKKNYLAEKKPAVRVRVYA